MNQIQTLEYSTINGLKSLQLDELTTTNLNADTISFENLNTRDIELNNRLLMDPGSFIEIADNSAIISDTEISYLDGLTSNVQNQITLLYDDISGLNVRVTDVEDEIVLIQDDISGLNVRVMDVEDEIVLIQDDISGLNVRIDNVENSVTDISGRIVAISYSGSGTMVNSKLNVTNDISSNGNLTLSGNITHNISGSTYTITNPRTSGVFKIVHYDSGLTMRTLQIDQFINVSGINDLYSNKLYIGGTLIDFNSYNTTRTNTQKITYSSGTDTTTISSKLGVTGAATLYGTIDIYGNATFLNDAFFYDNVTIGGAASLIVGATTLSQTELSYLDNASSNIQSQLNGISSDVTTLQSDVSDISGKVVAISYSGETNINSKLNVYNDLSCNGVFTLKNLIMIPNTYFMIRNTTFGGAIQIQNFDSGGIGRTMTIDQFINVSGINDLYAGKLIVGNTISVNNGLTINNITHTPGINYIIQNNTLAGSLQIKNKDFVGTVRTMTIDQFINVSGINDFYCNKANLNSNLTVNGVSNLANNLTMNSSSAPARQITGSYYNFSSSSIAAPTYVGRIYTNGGVSSADMVFDETLGSLANTTYIFYNNISSVITTVLKLANNVILGAPLQFADATIQTTAMTVSYLTGVIQSVAGAMTQLVNPSGSVVMFAGSSTPSGWLLCNGALVSKTTYASLWSAIGDTYLNGRSANANNFYLPDLREMYIKGSGQNFTYTKKYTYSGGNALGAFLDQSVLNHYHSYTDKGDGTKSVSTGTSNAANDNQRTNNTDAVTYHADGTVMVNENRPQTVCMNYIIKH